jgi:hypothetical protein
MLVYKEKWDMVSVSGRQIVVKAKDSTVSDELRWRAESLVDESFRGTSTYKKAVRNVMRELKATQTNVRKTLKGK